MALTLTERYRVPRILANMAVYLAGMVGRWSSRGIYHGIVFVTRKNHP
jgi:hypothetical protein